MVLLSSLEKLRGLHALKSDTIKQAFQWDSARVQLAPLKMDAT